MWYAHEYMYKHVNYFSLLICWVQQTFELNTLTIREIKSLSLVLTVFKNQGRVSMRQNLGNYKLQRLQGSIHLCSAFPESSHKLPSCLSQASPVPTLDSWGISPRLPIRHCLKPHDPPQGPPPRTAYLCCMLS